MLGWLTRRGKTPQKKTFTVFADAHQFYLWDRDTDPLAPEDYTDEDVKRRIKAGPHVVVIQPEREMEVPVEVEVRGTEPDDDPTQWDHVAEASLHLPTGNLQVHECTGGAVADLKVAPGWYRVRSFHGGFGTISADGLDGSDHYRIVLWPAPAADVVVLKQAPTP